jgi:hypothetical protein
MEQLVPDIAPHDRRIEIAVDFVQARAGLLKELKELVRSKATISHDLTRRANRELSVIRNGQPAKWRPRISQDHVTAGLMVQAISKLRERAYKLAS